MSNSDRRAGATIVKWAGAVLVAAALIWPMVASARDADGSRVGARPLEVGATAEDKLAPPDDGADWRYFEVEETRDYRVELTHEPTKAAVGMKLTRATGETVDEVDSSKGKAAIKASLEPGLYYFEVASEASITYSVSVTN